MDLAEMLSRLNKRLTQVLRFLIASSCGGFVIVVLVGVFSRYVVSTPFIQGVELARLLFVWSCFLAAALTYYQNAHVSITFLVDRLTGVWQSYAKVLIHVLVFFFLIVVLFNGVKIGLLFIALDFPLLGISKAWLYWQVPLSMAIMLSFNLEFLVTSLVNKDSKSHSA